MAVLAGVSCVWSPSFYLLKNRAHHLKYLRVIDAELDCQLYVIFIPGFSELKVQQYKARVIKLLSRFKIILHQFWVKTIFPWKFNFEYGGTFTKLFMHVSSRNMFPRTRNLQIRVHVYRPRHYLFRWFPIITSWRKVLFRWLPIMTSWRKDKQSWMLIR
jgi:hypothetical protein